MTANKKRHVFVQHRIDRRAQKRRMVTYVAQDFTADEHNVTTATPEEQRYFRGYFEAVERSRFNVRRPFTVFLTADGDTEEVDIAAVDEDSAAAIANDLISRGWFVPQARVRRVAIL